MMQKTLPLFDEILRPFCALCGEQVALVGQYSPVMPHAICKACSQDYPLPVEVFTTGGKDRLGIKINEDAPIELRNQRMALELMVKRAATNDDRPVVKWNISGRTLRGGVRLSRMEQYSRWTREAKRGLAIEREHGTQLEFPLCNECGNVHTNGFKDGTFRLLCLSCEDKKRVESLWKNKGIFDGDDVETILDRLNKAFPDLFERGVLPDYWFSLMAQEVMNDREKSKEILRMGKR